MRLIPQLLHSVADPRQLKALIGRHIPYVVPSLPQLDTNRNVKVSSHLNLVIDHLIYGAE